jgi:peroxisomal 3,2-trans-enoyl-CoA isomerase
MGFRGADVSVNRNTGPSVDVWRHGLRETVSSNLNITHAFYTHTKILVTALNGPVVGLSDALSAFSDFIYCAPHTYFLTPFSSLGLLSEGGASLALVKRMVVSKANEALLMSRRIPAEELLACGYVNRILDCGQGDDEKFLGLVLAEIEDKLGSHLIGSSLIKIKTLLSIPMKREIDTQLVAELFGGLERVMVGIPQKEFEKIKNGQKRHKL